MQWFPWSFPCGLVASIQSRMMIVSPRAESMKNWEIMMNIIY